MCIFGKREKYSSINVCLEDLERQDALAKMVKRELCCSIVKTENEIKEEKINELNNIILKLKKQIRNLKK